MNTVELNISDDIKKFLLSHGYAEDFSVTPIAGAGSGRKYYRIQSGSRVSVLQESAKVDDDFKRFVDFSKTFRDFGLPVPRVYAVDESACQVLQEDMGTQTLLDDVLSDGKFSGSTRILYQEVIDTLNKWQKASSSLFASRTDLWLRRFDYAALKWETDYFTENYLKAYKGFAEIPDCMSHFFATLALVVDAQPKVLMHRDFQSQNIMVKPNSEIAFVDFQGARRGSMYYDLASLLWDPYVSMPVSMVKDFFDYWYHSSSKVKDFSKEEAWEAFLLASLQRVMQAMGAYCFLSKVKKIEKFEKYIEPGRIRLKEVFNEFKQVAAVLDPCVSDFMDKALA